jgi:7-cyano-7-deazaguanine synthase
MARETIAVLVSGGLDSSVLVADYLSRRLQVTPIFVEQGLRWERVEREWLVRFLRAIKNPALRPLQTLQLPMAEVYGDHWSTRGVKVPGAKTPDKAVYLPGRNLTLTVKAAVFCAMRKIRRLAVGSLGHNPFPDASPAFFQRWSKALSQGLAAPIRVEAPYRALSKERLVRQWQRLPLQLTFSCIAPRGIKHCGKCNKCAERQRAFRRAGVPDETVYVQR